MTQDEETDRTDADRQLEAEFVAEMEECIRALIHNFRLCGIYAPGVRKLMIAAFDRIDAS
jgi:hypothetical protein